MVSSCDGDRREAATPISKTPALDRSIRTVLLRVRLRLLTLQHVQN